MEARVVLELADGIVLEIEQRAAVGFACEGEDIVGINSRLIFIIHPGAIVAGKALERADHAVVDAVGHGVTGLARFHKEMSGVNRTPIILEVALRPIGESAGCHLHVREFSDAFLYIVIDAVLLEQLRFGKTRQFIEIEHRKKLGRRLLDATVRISEKVLQTAGEADCRE